MNVFIDWQRLGVPDKKKEMKESVGVCLSARRKEKRDLITIPMLKSSFRELEKTVLIRELLSQSTFIHGNKQINRKYYFPRVFFVVRNENVMHLMF